MKWMFKDKISRERFNQVKDTIMVSTRLLKIAWKVDKKLFVGTVIFNIIPAVIPFINFYIYKLVIDLVVSSLSQTSVDFNRLYLLVGLRVITYFTQDASYRVQEYIERLYWTKLPIYLNQLVFEKIVNLDIHYFENSKFKDTLEKVRDSIAWRPQQTLDFLFMWLQSLVQVLVAFVAIAQLNWFLVILIASVAVPEFINQTKQSKLSWGVWANNSPYRKKFWYLSGLLQHSWTIKEVKIFKLAKRFLKQIKSIQEKFYHDNAKLAKQNFTLRLVFIREL